MVQVPVQFIYLKDYILFYLSTIPNGIFYIPSITFS